MLTRVSRRWLVMACTLTGLLFGTELLAQTGVKRIAVRPVSGVEAAAIYSAYCADCHGATGRGDGRAAAHMAVPDLTRFTGRDGDTATLRATNHLRFAGSHAEGMPNIHRILMDPGRDEARAIIAEYNLARFVASLPAR